MSELLSSKKTGVTRESSSRPPALHRGGTPSMSKKYEYVRERKIYYELSKGHDIGACTGTSRHLITLHAGIDMCARGKPTKQKGNPMGPSGYEPKALNLCSNSLCCSGSEVADTGKQGRRSGLTAVGVKKATRKGDAC